MTKKKQKTKNKIGNLTKKISHGLLINLGAILTSLLLVISIKAWVVLFDYAQTLPSGFKEIGMMASLIVLITTIRFPTILGDEIVKFTGGIK